MCAFPSENRSVLCISYCCYVHTYSASDRTCKTNLAEAETTNLLVSIQKNWLIASKKIPLLDTKLTCHLLFTR